MTLREELQRALNNSIPPDSILAEYLIDCLTAFDKAIVARERWHGRQFLSDAEKIKYFVGQDRTT